MSDDPPVRRPTIAAAPRGTPAWKASLTLGALGVGTFLLLANARAARAQDEESLPTLVSAAIAAPAELPAPVKEPDETDDDAPAPQPAAAQPIVTARPIAPGDDMRNRLRAPVLVVDLAQATIPAGVQPRPSTEAAAASAPAGGEGNSLSEDELFSDRMSGGAADVVEAERMTGLDRMVPQGAIIAAVMETALNSDLPGFARALVQRDVMSFDGSAVLIPAGSRVVGQYKSAVAQGASRVFIIWTRVIRPDGVSIALASPAVDELGRGGVPGKVNRHFFQRFGGAILMSVLTGGINAAAAAAGGGSTIVVGTAGQASTLAGQAAGSSDIPPTITTPQGAPVRIFVARDLDFSKVGPYR